MNGHTTHITTEQMETPRTGTKEDMRKSEISDSRIREKVLRIQNPLIERNQSEAGRIKAYQVQKAGQVRAGQEIREMINWYREGATTRTWDKK